MGSNCCTVNIPNLHITPNKSVTKFLNPIKLRLLMDYKLKVRKSMKLNKLIIKINDLHKIYIILLSYKGGHAGIIN